MNLLRYIYRTNSFAKKQNAVILFSEPSKVIFSKRDTNDVKKLNWLVSKRTNFLISSEYIFIGNNRVKRRDIISVDYFNFKSFVLINYQVLKIELTSNQFIYVGLNHNLGITEELNAQLMHTNKKNNWQTVLIVLTVVMFILYYLSN